MARLLVLKSTKEYRTDQGYAIPIALEEDDGSIKDIGDNEFPNNNRIFISKEYEKIDEKFKDRELFFLKDWQEDGDGKWKENNNFEKYYSKENNAIRTETNTYLPIIKMNMPDIETGRVENGFGIPVSNSPFFILSNNIVSGPFLSTKEDEYWLLTPTTGINPLNLDNNYIAEFEFSNLKKAEIIINNEALGSNTLILTSLKRAAEVKFNKKDYISNAGIIKYFGKSEFGRRIPSITKREATKLSQIIDEHYKKKESFNNNERLKRLKSILDDFISSQDYGGDIIENFLTETEKGRGCLDKYITDHRESILKGKSEELSRQTQAHKEHYDKELADVKAKIEEKRSELSGLNLSIEQVRNNQENAIQEIKKKTKK